MRSCLILMPTLVYFLFLLAKVLTKIFFAYQVSTTRDREKLYCIFYSARSDLELWFPLGEGGGWGERHSGLTLQLRQIENLLQ